MNSFAPRIRVLLHTVVVTVAVGSAMWLCSVVTSPSQPPAPEAVAEGGQWGNKGGRGIC